jgi:hypothetical protein
MSSLPRVARRLTYGRSAAGPLTGALGAPSSMPDDTMYRLEGAVAGQLQCRVRCLVAGRVSRETEAGCTRNIELNTIVIRVVADMLFEKCMGLVNS